MYTLKDIESETGFGDRRIRYYIKEIIGSGYGTTGRGASYPKHVRDKLLFIRRIQEKIPNLRLADFRTIIEQTPDQDLARVADGKEPLEIADVRGADGIRDLEIRAKTGNRHQKVVAVRFDQEPLVSSTQFSRRPPPDREDPDSWKTIKFGKNAELRIRAEHSASKWKQLKLLGELAKSILHSE